MKTVYDITQDVYDLIKGSELHNAVNGTLCKAERPLDSRNEDITINVLSNQNGQTQEALVQVKVYVHDEYVEGRYQKDTLRIKELSKLAADLFDVYNSQDSYRITLECQTLLFLENNFEHIIYNELLYKNNNE